MSSEFAVEAFTLLGVGLTVIAARTYSRLTQVGLRGFEPDDYAMLLAGVVYSAETALAYSVGSYWQGLANNDMSDEYRRNLDADSEEYRLRVGGSKTQLAGWSSYTFLLWLLKFCMCYFYLRLTSGLQGSYRKKIYIGFGLILSTWLAVLFSILFGCGLPFEKNWQIYPNPGNYCQPAISRIDIFVTVVLNVITDFYLMSIPIPMLWQASLPRFKKVALFICFSGGIFVTTAGILRCVLIVTDSVNGAQLAGSWAVRETFVAVFTTNMPMLWKFFSALLPPLLSSISRHTRSNNHIKTPDPGSFQLQDSVNNNNNNNNRRGGGPKTMYPITALSDSEERIIQQQHQRRDGDEADEGSHGRACGTAAGITVERGFEVSVKSEDSSVARSTDSDRDIGDIFLTPDSTVRTEVLGHSLSFKRVAPGTAV